MGSQIQPRTLLLVAALLVALATGCGSAIRKAATEAPHAAVPVVVDETLKAGEDARTRERIAAVLATPEVRTAIAEVARAAVAAALEEAASDDSRQHVVELTNVVTKALAESIARDLVPAAVAGGRASLKGLSSAKETKVFEEALASVAATTTRVALRTAAEEIPTTIGPASRESLARELQAPDLRVAVSGLVGDVTRQVLKSSSEAVAEAQAERAATGRRGPLDQVRRMLTASWLLALGAGIVVMVLVAWMLKMRRRTKRYRGALLELVAQGKDGDRDAREGDPARAQRLLELLQ